MRDHALEFVPVQLFQSPRGDANGDSFLQRSGGEGIDAVVALQDKQPGHRDGCGDGHFRGDVTVSAQPLLPGLQYDQAATHPLGDVGTIPAEPMQPVQGAGTDEPGEKKYPLQVSRGEEVTEAAQQVQVQQVHGQDVAHDPQGEGKAEPADSLAVGCDGDVVGHGDSSLDPMIQMH